VICGQQAHHLLGRGALSEGGEAAQVGEQHRDVHPSAGEQRLAAVRDHGVRHLWRQEAAQPTDPLDLHHLLEHAALEGAVPGGELGFLRLHLVVQRLGA
jgi:hypothetical protein